MRLGVTMPVEDGLSGPELVELAQLSERCGAHTVLCGEVAGPEVMALLGALAVSTQRVRLASGIVASFTRSPALAAMGFATLSSLAPGRIVAGIGASSPVVVRRWHGAAFDAPLTRTREFVAALRACLAGGKVDFTATQVAVRDFRLAIDPRAPVPIWLAAMNPRMLCLAGAIADGVFLTWSRPDEIAEQVAVVRGGAEQAGRDPDQLEVVASFWGYAGPAADRAIARLRRVVLSYATVPTHAAAFTAAFPGLAEATAAWNAGDRAGALALVPERAVGELCAADEDGTAAATMARRFAEVGVDLPVLLAIGAGGGDHDGPFSTVRMTTSALGLA
jgi:alkanesulfonate monooxygenase SsuD/methylene tetrahydromethanopterin reductase-like flavin-dependent oxidoreductase (luciferase family)